MAITFYHESTCPGPDQVKRKSCLQQLPELSRFISHCCRQHPYYFEIKKSGDKSCNICKPIRLSEAVFQQIKPFPDPETGEDNHYKPFDHIYGSEASKKFQPSLSKKSKKQRTLPFHGKLQHVLNADLMLECEECGMWRLVLCPTQTKGV